MRPNTQITPLGKGWVNNILFHNVAILEYFCYSDFTWNQFFKFKNYLFYIFSNFEFWFWYIFVSFEGWNFQKVKIQSLENCKNRYFFELLKFQKSISRKIWVAGNVWIFHTVYSWKSSSAELLDNLNVCTHPSIKRKMGCPFWNKFTKVCGMHACERRLRTLDIICTCENARIVNTLQSDKHL